ncbi:MAG: 2-oxoacid:acceptor oxidoreductase family protein [Candidatus Hodarchaeota archaeon]
MVLIMEEHHTIAIAIHGRGGQGAVTASNMLVKAAHLTGKYPHVMAVPFFGAERRGAPVSAYARISTSKIHDRSRVYSSDVMIIMDPSILKSVNPISSLKKDGMLLVNSHEDPKAFRENNSIPSTVKLGIVDLVKICLDLNLMVEGNPIVNTPILGALCKIFPNISIDVMVKTIKNYFSNSKKADLNAEGAKKAYEELIIDE